MPTGVVLLAAGRGRRFGGRSPKQFLPMSGEPLFARSLRVFSKMRSVREIALVVERSRVHRLTRAVRSMALGKPVRVIAGGAQRGDSVRNGLRSLDRNLSIVLIHDAARPLVTAAIASRVERAAARFGAALAAWPLSDTVKKSRSTGFVAKTIPRDSLWIAQTPQGFRRNVADACLLRPRADATDDTNLAERRGFRVKLVPGSPTNIKITRPADMTLCRVLAEKNL